MLKKKKKIKATRFWEEFFSFTESAEFGRGREQLFQGP